MHFTAVRIFLVLAGLAALLIIPTDLPHLTHEQRLPYLVGRGIVIALYGLCFALLRRGVSIARWTRNFGIVQLLFLVHGQWFRPGYYLGYLQSVMVLGMFFPGDRRAMRLHLLIGALVFIPVFWFTKANYGFPEANSYRIDIFIAFLIVNLIALICHHLITGERKQAEETFRRFADTGRYTAMVLHDLKNLVQAPALYSDLLARELLASSNSQVRNWLTALQGDLLRLRTFVLEMNQLTARSDTGLEPVDVRETLERARELMHTKMGHVELRCPETATLRMNRSLFLRIALNVFSNSVDAFAAKDTEIPRIDVEVSEGRVVFRDNAGGFPAEILEALRSRSSEPITTKQGGSGIGTMIIRDYMDVMGGTVRFLNDGSGAVVELRFPAPLLRRNAP